MDYTVANLQVEVNAPSEDVVVAYAQAFTNLGMRLQTSQLQIRVQKSLLISEGIFRTMILSKIR